MKTQLTPKTVVLFTNLEAVDYEMAKLTEVLAEVTEVLAEVTEVKKYLADSNVLVNALTIEQACMKRFDSIVENFKSTEAEKLSAFEKQFGTIAAITGDGATRLQEMGEQLREKLLAGLPLIHYQSGHYWEYINFETLEVKQGIDKKFFERKNSIVGDAEMVKHHRAAVEAYQYFLNKFPDYNPEAVVGLLLKRNYFDRTCELNLEVYDRQKRIRDFVSNRMNEPDYSQR